MATRPLLEEVSIYDFGHEFLVICPNCSQMVHVRDKGKPAKPRIVLSCTKCAHTEAQQSPSSSVLFCAQAAPKDRSCIIIGAPVDWYFHLPLWLQTPCCRHTLWFYNMNHLEFIEDYVGATLRERRSHPFYRNRTLSSRLPAWIGSAKNRSTVLKCIEKVRDKVQRES